MAEREKREEQKKQKKKKKWSSQFPSDEYFFHAVVMYEVVLTFQVHNYSYQKYFAVICS